GGDALSGPQSLGAAGSPRRVGNLDGAGPAPVGEGLARAVADADGKGGRAADLAEGRVLGADCVRGEGPVGRGETGLHLVLEAVGIAAHGVEPGIAVIELGG